jgi:hypothetical protein
MRATTISTNTISPTSPNPETDTKLNTITNNYIVDGGVALASRGVTVYENSVTLSMQSSPRIYMLDKSGNNYQMFDLRGKKLSFDINLVTVPCGYNIAFYFSQMSENATVGFGYCDAQGQGYACPEMDIFEGNSVAMKITSHPCDSSCDRNGAANGLFFDAVGNQTHIDTSFIMNGDSLNRIDQSITWNGQTKSLSIIETSAYGGLKQMGEAFKSGMVLIMSIWTAGQSGMDWLNGQCNTYATDLSVISGSFSNMIVRSL